MPLNYSERFHSLGVNFKFAFSAAPGSLYIKAGPHYYERREFTGIFRSESRNGIGLNTAVGWQYRPASRVHYGVEAWYRTLDDFDAYGLSAYVSFRLNIFN